MMTRLVMDILLHLPRPCQTPESSWRLLGILSPPPRRALAGRETPTASLYLV